MFALLVDETERLDDQALVCRLQDIEQQRRALDAEMAAIVNVAERRGVYRTDGHRDGVDELFRRNSITGPDVGPFAT